MKIKTDSFNLAIYQKGDKNSKKIWPQLRLEK